MDDHKNFGYAAVATAPSPAISGTTMSVTGGYGAKFPTAPFNVVVWPANDIPLDTNAEIIRVTSKGAGDNWTIQRAQEGSTARPILVGDQVSNSVTDKWFTDIEVPLTNHMVLTGAGAHGDSYVLNTGDTIAGQLIISTGGLDVTGAVTINDVGADVDVRIEGDTATQLLVTDAGLDAVQIGTTTAGAIADFRSSIVVINELGADRDFRIEGDTASSLFYLDASTDRIGINISNPQSLLSLGSTLANSKLAMYDSGSGATYGFGIQSTEFRFHVDSSASRFSFYDAPGGTAVLTMLGAGRMGIGQTTPTATLHLKAGTSASNSAPLKFTSGTNMSGAEAGAMEWDGSRLYITQTSGTTRQTVAYSTDLAALTLDDVAGWYAQPDIPYTTEGWPFRVIDMQITTKFDSWDFLSTAQINGHLDEIVATGANYAAHAIPYNRPDKWATWIPLIRARKLLVWHRAHWDAWEGDNGVGDVTSITRSGTTATVTCTEAHGMASGESVIIAGASPSNYNGKYTITVTSSTVFTYTVAGSPSTPATGTITWRMTKESYLTKTAAFITAHPEFFEPGDMFGMNVESSNADTHSNWTFRTPETSGGSFQIAQYNQFQKDQVLYANQAFDTIGLFRKVHTWPISLNVSLMNLDGVTWNDTGGDVGGLTNADIHTYFAGRLTIDHYQDASILDADEYRTAIRADMANFVQSFPGCVWFQGEIGYHTEDVVTDENQNAVMSAIAEELLERKEVIGVCYWVQLGSNTTSLWEDSSGTIVPGGRLAVRGAIIPSFKRGLAKSQILSDGIQKSERYKLNFIESVNTTVVVTDDPDNYQTNIQVLVMTGSNVVTNYVPNPSFELTLDHWTAYGTHGTISRDITVSQSGSASLKQDNGASNFDGGSISDAITLAAGTYTLSVYVKMMSSAVNNACVIIREVGGAALGTNINLSYPGNTNFNRYTNTFTIASPTDVEILCGLGSYGSASDGVVYFDAIQLEAGGAASAYFDGSTTDAPPITYDWAGDPHDSISTKTTVSPTTASFGKGAPSLLVAAVDAPEDILNRADYVCDGVDDDVEIQLAMDACKYVTLSPGHFRVSTDPLVPTGSRLSGSGPGTVITIEDDTTANGLTVDGVADVIIENIQIDGNKVDTDNGGSLYITVNCIHIIDSTNVTVRDCICHDAYYAGISVDTSVDVKILGNTCYDSRDNQIFLRPSNTGVVVEGNIVHGSSYSGIQALRSDYVIISGNTAYDNGPTLAEGDGIGFEGCRYSRIEGNIIYANGIQGIKVDYTVEGGGGDQRSLDCVVVDNTIFDHDDTGNGCGIEVLRSDNTIVERNRIKTCKYGINVGEVVGITIKDNVVSNSTDQGIRTHDTGSTGQIIIDGNTVRSAGSHGMEVFQNKVQITNNIVSACSGEGIRVSDGNDAYIAFNTIFDNTGNGVFISSGANVTSGNFIEVKENTFYNTGSAQDRALYEESGGGPTKFVNNKVFNMATATHELSHVQSIWINDDMQFLTAAPPLDHTISGAYAKFTAGESLVYADFCYFKSDGKMWKADADAIATAGSLFMAMGTYSADAVGNFALPGSFIRDDTWAWTVGGIVYLSTTAGGATQTAPSGTDDVIQVLGVAMHADRMFFNPSLVQIEHT